MDRKKKYTQAERVYRTNVKCIFYYFHNDTKARDENVCLRKDCGKPSFPLLYQAKNLLDTCQERVSTCYGNVVTPIKDQYYVIPNGHFHSKLTCIKQPPNLNRHYFCDPNCSLEYLINMY